MNILVVDSDQDTIEMVCSWLQYRGHTVHFCFSADKARAAWLARKPDVAIVDIGAPGVNMLRLLDELRPQHDAMILAMSDEPSDKLMAFCLDSGADAFLAKPFLPKLLISQLNALGRRMRTTMQRQPATIFSVGPIRLDTSRNEVRINGETKHLTPIESRILQKLAMNAGDICTLQQIVSHAWGYGEGGDTYLIKAHIRNLRDKIEPVPSEPRYIRTAPGIGYMLTAGTSAASGDARAERASQGEELVETMRDEDGDLDLNGASGASDEGDEGDEGDADEADGDAPERDERDPYARRHEEPRPRRVVTGFAARASANGKAIR